MDIFSFIDSKDVENYLQRKDYKFTPIEAAWVIWHSHEKPLTEKFEAWKELIAHYPNTPVIIEGKEVAKLDEFLNKYMKLCENTLQAFYKGGENFVYGYERIVKRKREISSRFYKSYQDILTVKDHSLTELLNAHKYIFTQKRYDDDEVICKIVTDTAFEPNPISIEFYGNQLDELSGAFEKMRITIPTPFHKGDLLIPIQFPHYAEASELKPFVLECLENCFDCDTPCGNGFYLNEETYTAMTGCGCFINDEGAFFHQFVEDYFDCEYYRDALKGKDKILYALSNYKQDYINVLQLLNASQILLLEEKAQELRRPLGNEYNNNHLMGLDNEYYAQFHTPFAVNVSAKKFDETLKRFPDLLPDVDDVLHKDDMLYQILASQSWKALQEKTEFDRFDEERYDEELRVIADLQYAKIFLAMQEVVKRAKTVCFPLIAGTWNTSFIAYLLGITYVNPLHNFAPYQRLFHEKKGKIVHFQMVVPKGYQEKVMQAVGEEYAFFVTVREEDIPFISANDAEKALRYGIDSPTTLKKATKRIYEIRKEACDECSYYPENVDRAVDLMAGNAFDELRERGIDYCTVYYEFNFRYLQGYGIAPADIAIILDEMQKKREVDEFKSYYLNWQSRRMNIGKQQESYEQFKNAVENQSLRVSALSWVTYLFAAERIAEKK